MQPHRTAAVSLAGITLEDAGSGAEIDLGKLSGVHALVLLRHRH